MCSLDLYNWYENRFPHDFAQLVQIKHYNISDLSFLLSGIWYKLDYGEKLLMCAVYYDDFNLAKQMISEKLMFRVNPFWSNNYLTQSSCRTSATSTTTTTRTNSTGSLLSNHSKLDNFDPINSNVFDPFDDTEQKIRRRVEKLTIKNDEKKCWCKNRSYLTRSSLSSLNTATFLLQNPTTTNTTNNNLKLTNTINTFNNDDLDESLNVETSTYYFNQNTCEVYMQSAFYLGVKLNNVKMCKLFIDNLKSSYLTTFSSKLIKKQQIQYLNQQLKQDQYNTHSLLHCFRHHRKHSMSNAAPKSAKIRLNSMLSNNELVKLLILSLSQRNYEISMLLLTNVTNPRQILQFQQLSESFIYNQKFCLFLIKMKIVNVKEMLKEAINRHATSTTYLIINYYLEQFNLDVDLLKFAMSCAILIGDLNIFRMTFAKLAQFNHDSITVSTLLLQNYQSVLDGLKLSSNQTFVDFESTKKLAKVNKFDLGSFYDEKQTFKNAAFKTSLTYSNRVKLMKYLFDANLDKVWSDLESRLHEKLLDYDRIFAAAEFKESLYENFNIENLNTLDSGLNLKRFFIGKYLVYAESEPLMAKLIIETSRNYKVSRNDLIQAAKSEISELTMFYLMRKVDFLNDENLLQPADDNYGNFLEILFCRMVRCESETREKLMRHLFFDAVVLKHAKMTCSTNLLSVFMSKNEAVRNKLIKTYFPMLFYLSSSFPLFLNEFYYERFGLLAAWLVRNCLLSEKLEEMSQRQVEGFLFEFYALGKIGEAAAAEKVVSAPCLRDMARNEFMKSFIRQNGRQFTFLNVINESARRFILYFNEIKALIA